MTFLWWGGWLRRRRPIVDSKSAKTKVLDILWLMYRNPMFTYLDWWGMGFGDVTVFPYGLQMDNGEDKFAKFSSAVSPAHSAMTECLDFCKAWGLFFQHGSTSIPAWTCSHMPSKVWDEITYPFPNFKGATINNFIPHFIMNVITYPW